MPNNLLLNPAVEGNISSCETKVTVVTCASRDSLFTCQDKGYATNNCTGETEILTSWSLTGTSLFLAIFIGIIVAIIAVTWASDY